MQIEMGDESSMHADRTHEEPSFIGAAAKRLLDCVLAGSALTAFVPLLGAVAVLILIRMGRPVLFRQQRHGLREQLFTLHKFRTMTEARGPGGGCLPDGERLTTVGRVIRKLSIDELPQLWNVLKGDMSLVGPRPLLVRYFPYFTVRERLRYSVRPGITGWAQIHGRNQASWDERLANDVWYVEHWSLWLDFKILVATVASVLTGRGVVEDARSAMLNLDEERAGRLGPQPIDGADSLE